MDPDPYSEYGSRKLLNTDPIRIRIHNTAKYIFCQLSLWIVNLYLKSYIFCLHFNLYLHVWIRIRNTDPDPGSSWIRIRIHNTAAAPKTIVTDPYLFIETDEAKNLNRDSDHEDPWALNPYPDTSYFLTLSENNLNFFHNYKIFSLKEVNGKILC